MDNSEEIIQDLGRLDTAILQLICEFEKKHAALIFAGINAERVEQADRPLSVETVSVKTEFSTK